MNVTDLDQPRMSELVGSGPLLLAALQRIDVEGWDGETGRLVLHYAMCNVVRPTVKGVGFTGAVAAFAEATGWAAAWEALSARRLRSAPSPWGVVTSAVRFAVLNERIAEAYGTDARSAWRVHRHNRCTTSGARRTRRVWTNVADASAMAQPVSLTPLLEAGYEPPAPSAAGSIETAGPFMIAITELLVSHGWRPEVAAAAVMHVAEHARPNPSGPPKAHGWRELALELRIPPWQARRVTVLLLGVPGWPGLVERIATGGPAALIGPEIEAAVQATCERTMGPPARAVANLVEQTAGEAALAS
ncbi:MAG TPA: hypothetical protein VHV82_08375 [Sporichthyaceae bacterium]|nr:hypothetical protein [Sporichthyaceae bacterium]